MAKEVQIKLRKLLENSGTMTEIASTHAQTFGSFLSSVT